MNEEYSIEEELEEVMKNNKELKEEVDKLNYIIEKQDRDIANLSKGNQKLKKQLEFIRNGEYYNQLKFERDMLQDIVDKGEISKEDKKFIDCTHRNTELLEENQQLKEQLETSEYARKDTIFAIKNNCIIEDKKYTEICCDGEYLLNILDIDKGEMKDE